MTGKANPQPSRNAPCSCGSGKKYKRCCGPRAVAAHRPRKWGMGLGILAVVVIVGVALAQRAESPDSSDGWQLPLFGEEGFGGFGATDYLVIGAVDLSPLSEAQQAHVLRTANRERCPCRCNMTLAQCINTDRACPIRTRNLQRARQLVAQASNTL